MYLYMICLKFTCGYTFHINTHTHSYIYIYIYTKMFYISRHVFIPSLDTQKPTCIYTYIYMLVLAASCLFLSHYV